MSNNIKLDLSKYVGTYSISEAENIISKVKKEINKVKAMNINELSNLVLSNEDKYNQIVINLVDNVQDLDFEDIVDFLDLRVYNENLLLLIDTKRVDDIFVLNQLTEILEQKQRDFEKKFPLKEF